MYAQLAPPLLALIFEYHRAYQVKLLREVCKSFRDVLDDGGNSYWKDMLGKYSSPLVKTRVIYGKSVGVTALILKESFLLKTCVFCGLWFNTKKNRLHDILLCGRCSKKQVFRIVNLRKACTNYFLDYNVQKENHILVKLKKGRAYEVLLNHVRNVALAKYPNGDLEKRMNKRFSRLFRTELRKQKEKKKRIVDIGYKFCDILWETPSRVDKVLRDQNVLKDLVQKFGSRHDVFGDTLENRVRALRKCEVAARHLYDFGAMLTYMRKIHLLDDCYEVTSGHRCHPRNIFRHHVNEGLHFYELSRLHADSREELLRRSSDVQIYLVQKKQREEGRKQLAIAMCAEDSTTYQADFFNSFILQGEGNPVFLARQQREKEYLQHNNLAWETGNFLLSGHDQENAQRLATNNVLQYTKGYPPMMRTCIIDLPRGVKRGAPSCTKE